MALHTKLLRGLDERLRAQGWPSSTELLGSEGDGWISFCDMRQFYPDSKHHNMHYGTTMESLESLLSGIHCGGFDKHIYSIERDRRGDWAVYKYTNRYDRRPVRTVAEFSVPARNPKSSVHRD